MTEVVRKINVVGAGGFGTNLLAQLVEREVFGKMSDLINTYVIDTSNSNLHSPEKEKLRNSLTKLDMVPGADGSGKKRGENVEQIVQLVTDVVNRGFEPGLTILVYSASGGTGGVAGPEMHEQMVRRGMPVISMVLETDDSVDDVKNTLKTLKTLQHKASKGTRQFNALWDTNRNENGRLDQAGADERMLLALEDFLVLGHPKNHDQDSKDLYNFLNYSRSPEEPGVLRFMSSVTLDENSPEQELTNPPVSVTSILTKRGLNPNVPKGTGINFQAVLADDLSFPNVSELQFQIFGGLSAKKASELSSAISSLETMAAKAAEQVAGDALVTGRHDVQDDSGAFL